MTELVLNEEARKHTTEAGEWVGTANLWTVDDADSYEQAAEMLVQIKEMRALIVADFSESRGKAKTAKKAATDAYKAICDQEANHTDKCDAATRILKDKCTGWQKLEAEKARKADEEYKKKLLEQQKKEAPQKAAGKTPGKVAPKPPEPPPKTAAKPKVKGVVNREVWGLGLTRHILDPEWNTNRPSWYRERRELSGTRGASEDGDIEEA